MWAYGSDHPEALELLGRAQVLPGRLRRSRIRHGYTHVIKSTVQLAMSTMWTILHEPVV